MPNHISNHIEASKEVLDEILSIDDKGEVIFDFNVLIPMPDYIYQGDLGLAEEALYGQNNWYNWSLSHWGTKWGAYSVERVSDTVLAFETAWSHPVPVIKALSEKFSNESILVAYADENSGYNLGVYVIQNSKIVQEGMIDEGSYEAVSLAALLTGKNRIQIVRDEINELEDNWDKYKDYPGVEEELKGYKNELDEYIVQDEFTKITRPDFDVNNLRHYLEV